MLDTLSSCTHEALQLQSMVRNRLILIHRCPIDNFIGSTLTQMPNLQSQHGNIHRDRHLELLLLPRLRTMAHPRVHPPHAPDMNRGQAMDPAIPAVVTETVLPEVTVVLGMIALLRITAVLLGAMVVLLLGATVVPLIRTMVLQVATVLRYRAEHILSMERGMGKVATTGVALLTTEVNILLYPYQACFSG
jgi:hypothetical protein